jgi:predicted O-methyltransferase YrrM
MLAPRAILDLGSGFTTYVFSTYAAECADPPHIVSVDDSSHWLAQTQHFLAQRDCATGEILLLDDFLASDPNRFDLVLHDLGDMLTRAKTLVEAIRRTHPGGVVVLDDVNMPNYRELVERAAKEARCTVHDLRDLTLDETGRFAWALERR